MHGFEECRNGRGWFWVRAKADELRMVAVAFGLAAQDFLRQQCLAPECDQSFGVEIFWVHGPESHRGKLTKSAIIGELRHADGCDSK